MLGIIGQKFDRMSQIKRNLKIIWRNQRIGKLLGKLGQKLAEVAKFVKKFA